MVSILKRNKVYITSETVGDGSRCKQYDRISKINGENISTILEYNKALSKIMPGDSVKIEVYRGAITQGWMGNSITFASERTSFTVTAVQYMNQNFSQQNHQKNGRFDTVFFCGDFAD